MFNSKNKNEVLDFLEKQKKVKKSLSIVEQQAAKGALLEQPKYKNALEQALDEVYKMQEKGYGSIRELTQKYKDKFSKKGKVQYGRKLTTDVTTEATASVLFRPKSRRSHTCLIILWILSWSESMSIKLLIPAFTS